MSRRGKRRRGRNRHRYVLPAPEPVPAPTRPWRSLAGTVTTLLAVLLLGSVLWSAGRYALTPVEARQAAAGLDDTSVWLAPGTEGFLDADRVRQVVGDRPVVVAALAPSYTGDHLDACHDVARLQPRTLVVLYLGSEPGTTPATCSTARFPEPAVTEGSEFLETNAVDMLLFRLNAVAGNASRYSAPDGQLDRTAEVEEFVLAFDAAAVEEYPDGAPTRDAGASPRTVGVVAAQLAAVVGGLVLVHLLLRRLVRGLEQRRQERRVLAARRTEVETELSRTAGLLLTTGASGRGPQASAVADAAETYVLALAAFERAGSEEELAAVEQQLRQASRAVERV